jgi:hypothetical protein
MRKFLVQLAILSSIVFFACFLFSQVTFSDEFIVYKTKDTAYKKIGWNINLLENHSERIRGGTIFLGSSLVQGAINDSLMQQEGFNAINMGVPHNGNEIGLYFLNRLKKKKPREVIFLKGKTPFQGLHKMTPLLHTSSSLFKAGQGFNPDYISFVFKKSKLCLEYIFFKLLQGDKIKDASYQSFLTRKYGVIYANNTISEEVYNDTMERITGGKTDEYYNLYLNDYLYRNEVNANSLLNKIKVVKRELVLNFWMRTNFIKNTKSQEKFVQKAIEISRANHIEISKLYIPKLVDVKDYSDTDYKRSFYESVPSDSIGVYGLESYKFLMPRRHWADFDHLDESGAELYTEKILEKLR